ncbi:hypothetical protein [Aureivirga sp. CE67]|uniref:hypothetical protein n=1 Tax=Aureivirga sp. CE67 TaxID=1788983 RepID=UPI0018CB31E1|nr:hypothetical protein [Aureivirga sp. CE67]
MSIKKTISLLFLLLISIASVGQINVGKFKSEKSSFVKPKLLERFKKTTTIFVMSSLDEKDRYEELLKEIWTVTPFKVVNEADFKEKDYYLGNYSVAKLDGFKNSYLMNSGITTYNCYIYIDVFLFKNTSALNKIKKGEKTAQEVLDNLEKIKKAEIAQILLIPTMEYYGILLSADGGTKEDFIQAIYNDDFSTNNSLGFLKNNLQKLNEILQKDGKYTLLDKEIIAPELKKLASQNLYIQEDIYFHFMDLKKMYRTKKNPTPEDMKQILDDNYKYDYTLISKKELDQKILDNEPIYYLRFGYNNPKKFLHIVNAQTGEVVYKECIKGGFLYSVDDKQFKALSKAIKKASK